MNLRYIVLCIQRSPVDWLWMMILSKMSFGELFITLWGKLHCIHFLTYSCWVLDDVCYVEYVLHNDEFPYVTVMIDFVGSVVVCDFCICNKILIPEAIQYIWLWVI